MSVRHIKKDEPAREICDTIPDSGMPGGFRDYLMTVRQTLLMKLSALDKLLQLNRRCRHCGNDL